MLCYIIYRFANVTRARLRTPETVWNSKAFLQKKIEEYGHQRSLENGNNVLVLQEECELMVLLD